MDDRNIMEDLLLTTKGVMDLYMHGAVESSTTNVHQTFTTAFQDMIAMQDDLSRQMCSKGWCSTEYAPMQHIQQIKDKFSPTCC